jgi:serine/threonine protein kinase/ankyrin repeat protein
MHDWSCVLLEVRVLMHEYIRYHPNIVRFLGFTWAPGWGSSSSSSGSTYPMLVMEYARFGSLQSLQAHSAPLSFAVKQKLCHDVARGLSILHACGIIHGDLKHENVLVFDNPYNEPPGQPYLAKLADFGGAAMDMEHSKLQSLTVGTPPYQAPEISTSMELSADGLKKTDVYSFGLLFWRTILDGKDLVEQMGLGSHGSEDPILLQNLKKEDKRMLQKAYESIGDYLPPGAAIETLKLIPFTLKTTLRTDPATRNLAAAQAALRNGHVKGIAEHLAHMVDRNSSELFEYQDGIQRSSFNIDNVGFLLGKMGDFYDPQQNLPGYRSQLPSPAAGRFLFEPMKVKSLLSWKQQAQIVKELKAAARSKDEVSLLGIPPFKAAFYVFQSYLAEFGVVFDAEQVCYWLSLAVEPDDQWEEEILAQAWLWRICETLHCSQPVSIGKSIQYLRTSVVCGFRECMKDWKSYIETLTDNEERKKQIKELNKYKGLLRTYASGIGMWYYFPKRIHKQFNLSDLGILHQQIREELGEHYERYLQTTDQSKYEEADNIENRFDKIYVSEAGHGLLHYAATFGKVDVLESLLDTYRCDIDRRSTLKRESPLLCAVRSAQYNSALFLLQRGAQPGNNENTGDAPLHWLCGFEAEQEEQMRTLVERFLDAGANIEEVSNLGGSRGVTADWDNLLDIPTTPLGRAVIARNDGAIKVLLALGANPRGKEQWNDIRVLSAVEIAGMLFYSDILQTLLQKADGNMDAAMFDEAWVLATAHKRKNKSIDPSCLQSRLVRLGCRYKSAILDTFRLIRKSREVLSLQANHEQPSTAVNDLLYNEVLLGDADIVEALLELGYDPNGTEKLRPLQAAASSKNERMFKLLLRFGADVYQPYIHATGNKLTLLHAIASQTASTNGPDGVRIAEQLLACNVPVEVPLEQCPVTPFSLCVLSHCFEVADVLLMNGADLNPLYVDPQRREPPISLLGSLVKYPSEAALESIRYLIKRGSYEPLKSPSDRSIQDTTVRDESGQCLTLHMQTLQPSPVTLTSIGIPSRNLSVLHQVAWWKHDLVTDNWQLSLEIARLLLSVFNDTSVINEICPGFGTPLSIAAMNLNVDLVRMLLEKKANPSLIVDLMNLKPIFEKVGIERVLPHGTAFYVSLLACEGIILNFERISYGAVNNYIPTERLLSKAEDIVQLLLPYEQDEGNLQLWSALQIRKGKLLAAIGQI